ncbi:MAG: hypothetical protein PWP24_1697 [Clostridiales bacterium]|nr:hypothetical protein [Clostridiales bacterium]
MHDKKTEVVVIGGLAGILIASFLKKRNIEALVLEASKIGSGQTQNTTAKITVQHNLKYDYLIRRFGNERALQYAQANQQAILEYIRMIQEKHIDCDLEECSAYLYTKEKNGVKKLKQEALAAEHLGILAKFTKDTSLPFSIDGALCFFGQARFHPLKFLFAIAEGLSIYENTPVRSGYYFARMHQQRSYVIALKDAGLLDGMYLGIDPDGLSFRKQGNFLLLGGGNNRSGFHQTKGSYEMLLKKADRYYPNCEMVAGWSAQDCMTLDHIPYIGTFSRSTPNWHIATGFEKWGMTSSMVAAMVLSDQICGNKNPWEEVFSPRRFTPIASAKSFLVQSAISMIWEARPFLTKDAKRCTHLGCQLAWNAEERTWECPCHGSRFDEKGRLLDNPAQRNLEQAEDE